MRYAKHNHNLLLSLEIFSSSTLHLLKMRNIPSTLFRDIQVTKQLSPLADTLKPSTLFRDILVNEYLRLYGEYNITILLLSLEIFPTL